MHGLVSNVVVLDENHREKFTFCVTRSLVDKTLEDVWYAAYKFTGFERLYRHILCVPTYTRLKNSATNRRMWYINIKNIKRSINS